MATLSELNGLFFDEPLRQKVHAGLFVIGNEILAGLDITPPYSQVLGAHDNRVAWVANMIYDADAMAAAMRVLLGANAAFTVAQIQGASDAAILTATRTAVDGLATGFVAQ